MGPSDDIESYVQEIKQVVMENSQMLHYSSIKNMLNGQCWTTAMKHAVEETCCVVTLTTMTELKCKHFVVVVMCIAVCECSVCKFKFIMDLKRIIITIVYEVIFTSCLHLSVIPDPIFHIQRCCFTQKALFVN